MVNKTKFYELLNTDSSRAVADYLVNLISDNQLKFNFIFDCCISEKYPINMRAARVLHLSAEKYPILAESIANNITSALLNCTNEGVKRSFIKILQNTNILKQVKSAGMVINKCYEWILSEKESPAVRCYSIDLVKNYCKIEPELKNELISVLFILECSNIVSLNTKKNKTLNELN